MSLICQISPQGAIGQIVHPVFEIVPTVDGPLSCGRLKTDHLRGNESSYRPIESNSLRELRQMQRPYHGMGIDNPGPQAQLSSLYFLVVFLVNHGILCALEGVGILLGRPATSRGLGPCRLGKAIVQLRWSESTLLPRMSSA
jgi:hypothetical protein